MELRFLLAMHALRLSSTHGPLTAKTAKRTDKNTPAAGNLFWTSTEDSVQKTASSKLR